ncbi:hypothetical protein FAZ19_19285 [Sphingobacterium alkalisoli]|uniref:Uncharacterized protein n=1 Tax=Sphingobacterium alkalisoli TaxID=1874115 RepID=A0A4U0GUG8_9SPHI|nr:hypothetical protein FAZ19_19285 [Sphingobacterium alkalisoli]
MAIIYNGVYLPVAIVMGIAMSGATIAVAFRNSVFQLQISVFFFAVVALLLSFYAELPIPLNTLTVLMAFKLMVGFAGSYGKYHIKD